MSTPIDAAIAFEAVKIAWRQSKDGFILTLSIHPDEVSPDLAVAPVGTRYQIAVVELNDQNQPVVGSVADEGAKAVKAAAALCREPRFWNWVAVAKGGESIVSENECAEWMRYFLRIESRAELKTDPVARKKFLEMREAFLTYYRSGRGG
jgi:hypothetical protein